jgi:hypothetical protein
MIYTVKTFAAKLGVKSQTVNTWGKRGKLLIEAGKINDKNEINSYFLERRSEETKEVEENKTDKTTEKTSSNSTNEAVSSTTKLNVLKVAKLQEDYKFAKLRNEKISGKLIQTDIVGFATAEVIMRYKSTFIQQTDQLIRDTLNSLGVDNKILTETLSKLTDIANKASKRANIEAKRAIENSISDSLSMTK